MRAVVDLLPKQDMTPKMDVKDKKRRGKKLSGIKINPQTIFHWKTSQPGMRASMLSAKSTTNATHAASSSREKRILVATRALVPKETYARSAKVMSEPSTSRHLASSFAV